MTTLAWMIGGLQRSLFRREHGVPSYHRLSGHRVLRPASPVALGLASAGLLGGSGGTHRAQYHCSVVLSHSALVSALQQQAQVSGFICSGPCDAHPR